MRRVSVFQWQAGVPFDGRSTPPNPESWSNGGRGGMRVYRNKTATVFTGPRDMAKGDSLVFRFSLMVTPTRPLNLTKHWDERYFQAGGPVNYTAVAEGGATVLNMHQGEPFKVLNQRPKWSHQGLTAMAVSR